MTTLDSICEIVRKQEQEYTTGKTTLGKYVNFSQYETIERIDAYLNSKHTSGDKDSMGRDKPFFNIVTSAVNIWYRATDIDRKNIRLKATKFADIVGAFLATIHLQEWMKRSSFGTFLNEWGRSLARYGSSVLKFVEVDGKLVASVVPWNRMISDTIDFENNVKIEKLYYTPAQLRANPAYDQDAVDELIEAVAARQTMDGQTKDNLSDYIPVYEVHGELPLSLLTGKEKDEKTYRQQMHVVSFVGKKNSKKYDDFTLYKGRESQDPYMITHLIREDGRALAIGAVEHLFEAQWMTNHSTKQIKDQLDLASKLIFQTSDGNYAGRNVLTAIENGDILVYKENQPLTQIQNNSHDITSLQNFLTQWKSLGNEITGVSESLMGLNPPSGTAWRQTEALLQESHSLFEIMTENKGLAIEEMMRKFVIPHLKKQMDSTDEIVATLDDAGIAEFDAMFVPNEAARFVNDLMKKQALSGQVADMQNISQIEAEIRRGLAANGARRYLKPSDIPTKTWKDVFADLEWEVEVEVTGESTDKQAVLTTLTTMLQSIARNPMILQDQNMRMLFNKILTEVDAISPLQLAQAATTPVTPQPQAAPLAPELTQLAQ